MLSMYPACFYKEQDSGYSVIFPDLNYLATCGDSFADAMEMAIDCMAGYLYTCNLNGDPIPSPSDLSDIDAIAISKEIVPDEPVGEYIVNMVSVDVNAYAKEHFNKSVRKNLTIPAWLNTAATEMGLNFSKVLQEALITKLQAH